LPAESQVSTPLLVVEQIVALGTQVPEHAPAVHTNAH
jgi:hypothetical protein